MTQNSPNQHPVHMWQDKVQDKTPAQEHISPPEGYSPIESSSGFGSVNGPFYERTTDSGQVWRGMMVEARHTNIAGVIHGGMLMTLADIIMGQAAWAHFDWPAVTVNMSCAFMAPVYKGQWIEGTARVIGDHKALIHLETDLYSLNKPVFSATGVFKSIPGRQTGVKLSAHQAPD